MDTAVYSIQCTVYSVQYIVYSIQCTVYSVRMKRAGYSVWGAMWGVQGGEYEVSLFYQFLISSVTQTKPHSINSYMPNSSVFTLMALT